MEVGGLTRLMFQIGEDIAVPDVLYEEELREHHGELPGYGLRILEVRSEYVVEAVRLRAVYPGAGANDLLALALAKQEDCPLLTGDKALRAAALAESIEVMGTMWLMERFTKLGLITHDETLRAYEAMKNAGRRLPWHEAEAQFLALHSMRRP